MRAGSRCRARATAIAVALILAAAVAACGGQSKDRLGAEGGSTATTAGDVKVDQPVEVVSPSTTAPDVVQKGTPAKKAPQQTKSCDGAAQAFIPTEVPGYSLAANTDVTGQLPAMPNGDQYVKSAAGTVVTRSDGQGGGIVVIVFDPAISGILTASADTLWLGLTGAKAVEQKSINGYVVYTGASAEGKQSYATQLCQNVVMVVSATNADVALDITEKVLV